MDARNVLFHMDISFYISIFAFKGKLKIAQSIGCLPLEINTTQKHFHSAITHTHSERVAVLHLSHHLRNLMTYVI